MKLTSVPGFHTLLAIFYFYFVSLLHRIVLDGRPFVFLFYNFNILTGMASAYKWAWVNPILTLLLDTLKRFFK